MPFIDSTDKRNIMQQATPSVFVPEASFGETFAASLGNTIDENLSISGTLNREGWEERRRLITQKIDEGALDRNKYMDRRGRFDYNRAAKDLNDPLIKTDSVLTEERNKMLAQRREYTEDILERGNGMAQFLGMANAYMLDPISIATMPIALPATGAKSLSIAGRALLTARNAAAIEAATELAIQPFVYEHKQDIDSPYTYKDALENIAGAAVGAGVLGGTAGGLSGYLGRVIDKTESLGALNKEVEFSLNSISRLKETIEYGRASRKNLDEVLEDFDEFKAGTKTLDEAAQSSTAKLEQKIKTSEGEELGFYQEKMNKLEAAKQSGDLESYYQKVHADEIMADIEYLENLELQRTISGAPQRTPETYKAAQQEKAPKAPTTSRQQHILDEEGLADTYNNDMRMFNEIENPRFMDTDGNTVDATVKMKELDDELEGLESVLSCAYG